MSNKKVQLKIDVDIIDEETFAEHYTAVFYHLAEEKKRRRSIKALLDFVSNINRNNILNATYTVAISKDDNTHREEFVWLVSKPYDSNLGRYIKVTGCNCKEILLKVLAVC